MLAVVVSVGSELLRGDIVDTNAAFLARGLSELGFEVRRVEQAGDDLEDLTALFRTLHDWADVIVSTGGLGPTQDDLTRDAIAAAIDEDLFLDQSLVADIEHRFAALRRPMPRSNLRQALRAPSAESIPNPNGTAPGWWVRHDSRIIAAMPGPPGEMQPMWRESVEPRLEAMQDSKRAAASFLTFGLGESTVEERLGGPIAWRPDVTVATYAKATGVEVHVTARAAGQSEAEKLVNEAAALLEERLGPALVGRGDVTLASVVGEALRRNGMSLATMESATGGEVANLITDVTGSSDYFRGGVVAYTREIKAALGVDPDIMDRFGVISGETAMAMARAARTLLGTDVGIGVSGIAGTDAVEGKMPGTCYLAVDVRGATHMAEVHRPGNRRTVKGFFALCALDALRRQLDVATRVSL